MLELLFQAALRLRMRQPERQNGMAARIIVLPPPHCICRGKAHECRVLKIKPNNNDSYL
jgi:hypothetical protein